jgi:hypothetical protein
MLIARAAEFQRWASALMVSIENRTLEELDGERWGEPEYNSSLVVNCHRLRCVPLTDFSVGDLRLMIGQGFSLEYLVPLALEHLESNPFVEGGFYPGDLLNSVLGIERKFWEQNSELHRKMLVVVEKAKGQLNVLDEDEIKERVKEKLNSFG